MAGAGGMAARQAEGSSLAGRKWRTADARQNRLKPDNAGHSSFCMHAEPEARRFNRSNSDYRSSEIFWFFLSLPYLSPAQKSKGERGQLRRRRSRRLISATALTATTQNAKQHHQPRGRPTHCKRRSTIVSNSLMYTRKTFSTCENERRITLNCSSGGERSDE
jgi:hypothetical protein